MGFWLPLAYGLAAGIGLMAAFRWAMRARQQSRAALALGTALCGRLTLEDLKATCEENLPTWITFPEFERVKWINAIFKEVWPYLNKAASSVIRDTVEPQLEQYRPIGVVFLRFDKLTLGDVPPHIAGVRIGRTDQPSQVVLDFDVKWGGDPHIALIIQTLVVRITVQLRNLKFFARVRLIVQLIGESPCVGAVVVSLLATPKPKIEYSLKAIGGSLNAIPGVAGMIDEVVQGSLTDMLVWPQRIVRPVAVGYDTRHLEMKLQGRLTVTVVGAKHLRNVDAIGKSDPYVTLWTRNKYKVQTRVIDNDLNPTWDETFDLDVDDPYTSRLVLKVRDQGALADASLGTVALTIAQLVDRPDEEVEHTLTLIKELDNDALVSKRSLNMGTITIRTQYRAFTEEECEIVMESERALRAAKKEGKVPPGTTQGAAAAAGNTGKTGGHAENKGHPLRGAGHGVLGNGLNVIGKGLSFTASTGLSTIGKGISGTVGLLVRHPHHTENDAVVEG